MSTPYDKVEAQLWLAVSDLVGHGVLRQRLVDGCVNNLLRLKPEDFPPELRGKWERFKDALTWMPVEKPGEGTLTSTQRHMTDVEAEGLAQKVLEPSSQSFEDRF
jgi:hypothetical protein